MELNFKNVEERFEDLKKKFQEGGISRQEFIDEMKKLRLKDESGRYWMIGSQTGKWYFFDGKDWISAEPPTQKDQKAICVYCGFENRIDTETCARCGGTIGEEKNVCSACGVELRRPYLTCPRCSKSPDTVDEVKFAAAGGASEAAEVVLRAVQPRSALFFGGLLGALLGVVLGVFAGAMDDFAGGLSFLPAALADLQGKLLGAVILGLLGGVSGFVLFAAAGFLKAVLINFVLSLTGGIKLTVRRKDIAVKPESPPKSQGDGLGFDLKS